MGTHHTDLRNLEPPHHSGAVLVVDGHGRVVMCSEAVRELIGLPPEALCGRQVADLLADSAQWPLAGSHADLGLRHQDGTTVMVCMESRRMLAPGGEGLLLNITPLPLALRRQEDEALVRALFRQQQVGLAIHGMDLTTTRLNLAPHPLGHVPVEGDEAAAFSRGVEEELIPADAEAVRRQLQRVAETGEPMVDWVHSARLRSAPGRERAQSFSAFRLHTAMGRPIGVAVVFTDVTQEHAARERMSLLQAAAEHIGRSLAVSTVARELADVLVSRGFAGLAAVDLTQGVLIGQEPGEAGPGAGFQRVAVASADGRWPPDIHPLGATFDVPSLAEEHVRLGTAGLQPELARWRAGPVLASEEAQVLLPEAAESFLIVPLSARGLVLGTLMLWRTGAVAPFGHDDAALAQEIASRAALGLDNARRYTREHRTVEALQRSLLPPAVTETRAARTAGSYVPAGSTEGVGGAWFDVIPLSSSRLAFVIGDVTGHGLNAAATMGRLRTAVQTLGDLDLPPGELLAHLDDLVVRLGDVEPPPEDGPGDAPPSATGATCLYCVYDPVAGRCEMASAGHPPPVFAAPGAPAEVVGVKPGPPLGVDSLPFEPVGFEIPPDSMLAFYNLPLLSQPDGTPAERLARVRTVLAADAAQTTTPTRTGRALLDDLLPGPPDDDVTLLVARMRPLPPGAVATWRFPADPAVVAEARTAVEAQLERWNLTHLAFPTELITSELVTNAIRYGSAPVGLRLIRDENLVCEVSDASQTQPRLRRARLSDEGGRGLFLIAQLSSRWGSRYTDTGKTIWAEQPLGDAAR
ncbi:SpoIIE family protein phosphatase [Streptomyces sp. NPDC058691]|uniref:ATP-binding SpoIIE family protein phosphatase n=1 Tax=Streptomyces sp. NPDC058691 TaxID=3346601 RepID=UPI0036674E6E